MAFEEGASFGVTPSSGAALSPTLTFCVGYQERWAPVGDNDQPQRVSEFYWRSNCCWGHTEQQFEETLVTLFLSDSSLFFDSSLTLTEMRLYLHHLVHHCHQSIYTFIRHLPLFLPSPGSRCWRRSQRSCGEKGASGHFITELHWPYPWDVPKECQGKVWKLKWFGLNNVVVSGYASPSKD